MAKKNWKGLMTINVKVKGDSEPKNSAKISAAFECDRLTKKQMTDSMAEIGKVAFATLQQAALNSPEVYEALEHMDITYTYEVAEKTKE